VIASRHDWYRLKGLLKGFKLALRPWESSKNWWRYGRMKFVTPLQSVDGVCFYVDQKELTLELLFKVSPGLNWEDASVCLLAKEVLGPLCSTSILEEGEGLEDFFLVAGELLWSQAQVQHAGVKEGLSRTLFAREVGGRGEF